MKTMMEKEDNATWLFQRKNGSLPACSESFWTTTFAYFLLHLADVKDAELTIWRCTGSNCAPWYEPRPTSSKLSVSGLQFDDLSVECPSLAGNFFSPDLCVPPEIGGFRPDVLVKTFPQGTKKQPKYWLIETKTTELLQGNQEINYPRLVNYLAQHVIDAEFLLLISVGAEGLYRPASQLQRELDHRFGLLLWEDVIRRMAQYGFRLPGLSVADWQGFTHSIAKDARIP